MVRHSLAALLVLIACPAQASDDAKGSPDAEERERLRHFLGLRHQPHILDAPAVHHGLHMLNHKVNHRASVGPLKSKIVNPRAASFYNSTEDGSFVKGAVPIAAHVFEAKPKTKKNRWDMIKLTRADMCVEMAKEHGMQFDNKEKCLAFMDTQCEVPSKKHADKVEAICIEWDELVNMQANAGAPSPAAAASPGPAVAPDGMTDYEGAAAGKLPEQGFHGELVAHDNMVTQTQDWHSEYGPHSGPSYEEICRKYPDNQWCKLRGYHGAPVETPKESPPAPGLLRASTVATIVVGVCVCLAAVGMFT